MKSKTITIGEVGQRWLAREVTNLAPPKSTEALSIVLYIHRSEA